MAGPISVPANRLHIPVQRLDPAQRKLVVGNAKHWIGTLRKRYATVELIEP